MTTLLHTCGLVSMLPNGTGADKANIDVPVFLAFGITTKPTLATAASSATAALPT